MDKVEISLEHYNELRVAKEALEILNANDEKFWVSLRTSEYSTGCIYRSRSLSILSKDQVVLVLQSELKEMEEIIKARDCELNECENKLIKQQLEQEYGRSKRNPWYKRIFN